MSHGPCLGWILTSVSEATWRARTPWRASRGPSGDNSIHLLPCYGAELHVAISKPLLSTSSACSTVLLVGPTSEHISDSSGCSLDVPWLTPPLSVKKTLLGQIMTPTH